MAAILPIFTTKRVDLKYINKTGSVPIKSLQYNYKFSSNYDSRLIEGSMKPGKC